MNENPVLTGYFRDDATRVEIYRDDDGTYSYSIIADDGLEIGTGSGFNDPETALDWAREQDETAFLGGD